MAISQISTSVSILNTGLSGFLGASLTNYETSALSAIAAGSCFEIGGAFFLCGSETAINASSWTAITTATSAYLALAPSGTAGSQIITPSWTATAPVWSESKQGWYASAASIVRVIGSAYKVSNTQQETKTLYVKGRDRIFTKKINIGAWNMDANTTLGIYLYIPEDRILNCNVWIFNDLDEATLWIYPLGCQETGGSYIIRRSLNLLMMGTGTLIFNSTNFDDAVMNRGYVNVTYEA